MVTNRFNSLVIAFEIFEIRMRHHVFARSCFGVQGRVEPKSVYTVMTQ